MPAGTGAGFHLWRDCRCVRPKVFFEDDTLPGDHEGLDPGGLIFRGIRDQNQTFLSLATSAHARCGVRSDDSEVIPVKGTGLLVFSIYGGPGGKALGESSDRVLAGGLDRGFILCHCEFLAYLNCGGLIFSDSSELDFLRTGVGIKMP